MNKDFYSISTLDELRKARRNTELRLMNTKSGLKYNWSGFMNSMSPSQLFGSTVDGVVSVISEVSFLRRGYNMAMSLVDKIFADEDAPVKDESSTDCQG